MEKFSEYIYEAKTDFSKIQNLLNDAEKTKKETDFLTLALKMLDCTKNEDIIDGIKLMIMSSRDKGPYNDIIFSFRKTLSDFALFRDEFGDFRK